jgi:MFS transporter, OFA family, oxalate/formate antiporter
MQNTMNVNLPNRWLLAAAGVLIQVALGAVYAWSVFRDPLIKAFGWSIPQVTLTFSGALTIIAWVMLASSILPLIVGGERAVGAPVRAR